MSGNIITRREFNISRMAKEFPDTNITRIATAQWELELEYPGTDWDEEVYYDTGKTVSKGQRKINENKQRVNETKDVIKATPATIKKKQGFHKFPEKDRKKRADIEYNGHKRVDLR